MSSSQDNGRAEDAYPDQRADGSRSPPPETRAALAALRAARPLVQERRGANEVHEKAPNDIVTGTDVLVQNVLQQVLREHQPDVAFLGASAVALAEFVRTIWTGRQFLSARNYTLGMQQSASGQARTHAELERLESDLRVLSPVGIERAAWGWDRHEGDNLEAFHVAERAALDAIEAAGLGPEWDEWRRRMFFEVEGRLALVAWRAEHQRHPPHVHKAERAAFGAALGLFARTQISHALYATLVSAMNEALPWLLPEHPPAPAPAT